MVHIVTFNQLQDTRIHAESGIAKAAKTPSF